jgi:hypothetical protein
MKRLTDWPVALQNRFPLCHETQSLVIFAYTVSSIIDTPALSKINSHCRSICIISEMQ